MKVHKSFEILITLNKLSPFINTTVFYFLYFGIQLKENLILSIKYITSFEQFTVFRVGVCNISNI